MLYNIFFVKKNPYHCNVKNSFEMTEYLIGLREKSLLNCQDAIKLDMLIDSIKVDILDEKAFKKYSIKKIKII